MATKECFDLYVTVPDRSHDSVEGILKSTYLYLGMVTINGLYLTEAKYSAGQSKPV